MSTQTSPLVGKEQERPLRLVVTTEIVTNIDVETRNGMSVVHAQSVSE